MKFFRTGAHIIVIKHMAKHGGSSLNPIFPFVHVYTEALLAMPSSQCTIEQWSYRRKF